MGEEENVHTTIINSGDQCLLYFYILKSIPREFQFFLHTVLAQTVPTVLFFVKRTALN